MYKVRSAAVPHVCSMRYVVAKRKISDTHDFGERRLGKALDDLTGLLERYLLLQLLNEESIPSVLRRRYVTILLFMKYMLSKSWEISRSLVLTRATPNT